MEIVNSITNMLTVLIFLAQLALVFGAPVFVLQYCICDGRLKWPKCLLPGLSIFMLLLSAFLLFNADIREQAIAWVSSQFGMYTGVLLIEGFLPFISIVMTLVVTGATVLYYYRERRKGTQEEK